jgi:next-to-BRCA1 protein 1
MATPKSPPVIKVSLLFIGSAFLIHACLPSPQGSPPTRAPFRAPTSASSPPPPLIAPAFTLPPRAPSTLPPGAGNLAGDGEGSLPSPTAPCTSSLRFVQDANFPDDTLVRTGEHITKTWLVENNGSCNWDAGYRLRFTAGIPMGADTEQALYPARAGSQADIQIAFAAPDSPGSYRSEWRVYDPTGAVFGDTLYIQINVQTP